MCFAALEIYFEKSEKVSNFGKNLGINSDEENH